MKPLVTCPSCKRRVAGDHVVTMGVNAILDCPECLTRTEVSNIHRQSFRWTLSPGQIPVVRRRDDVSVEDSDAEESGAT